MSPSEAPKPAGAAPSHPAVPLPCDETPPPPADPQAAHQRTQPNRRILLIDDTASIHEDFRKILTPRLPAAALARSEAILFGQPAREAIEYELDSAYQGQEGHARAQDALAQGRPYALAIVDMRMPPGWDGMRTVEKLWETDPRLQVVICTAYSDHSWDEVLDRVAVEDRLLILKKPFDLIELSQLARSLTEKWNLAREAEQRRVELEALVGQLRASESALRYTSSELEAFAYSVAHDLQEPIARMSSFGRLLGELVAQNQDQAPHYVGRILANAAVCDHLLQGLRSLTDIARAQLRMQTVQVSRMAGELLGDLQRSSPERTVRTCIEEGLLAWADSQLLRIALAKLLENAWKFTSRREDAQIAVGIAQQTEELTVFFVRDNGCGFDMAHAERLFQNFHRLHGPDEYPGTGVGLVTVSRVLVRHGGRVWAESAPGQGSTFYFSLPRGHAAGPVRSLP